MAKKISYIIYSFKSMIYDIAFLQAKVSVFAMYVKKLVSCNIVKKIVLSIFQA